MCPATLKIERDYETKRLGFLTDFFPGAFNINQCKVLTIVDNVFQNKFFGIKIIFFTKTNPEFSESRKN